MSRLDRAELAGAATLLRFAARRDRVRLGVWVASIGALFLYSVVGIGKVYPTETDLAARARMIGTPTGTILSGPGYGLEHYTLGALMANELSLYGLVAVAILGITQVVRHTRAEEQAGRADLVRSCVVGRFAPAVAALALALLAQVAVGVVVAAVLVAGGLAVVDSLAMGAALVVTGALFAVVALLAAQVVEYSRAASGVGLAALGVAFALRAAGDAAQRHGNALSWCSPIGWAQQTRAYVDLRWWPLLLPLPFVVAGAVAALALSSRRDVGAGLVAPRPGPASGRLGGVAGLAWRQQRASVVAWAVGIGGFAVAFGSLISSVDDLLDSNPDLAKLLAGAGSARDLFAATMLGQLVFAVSGFAIASAGRMRAEEEAGRLEPVLAAGVSRGRWYWSSLAVTGVASVALLLLAGLGVGVGAVISGADGSLVLRLLGGALVFVPAVALTAGVVALAFGTRPALGVLAWVLLAYTYLVGVFGPLLRLPSWTRWASPFFHTPRVPGEAMRWTPVLLLTLVAAALLVSGGLALRRRDVPA